MIGLQTARRIVAAALLAVTLGFALARPAAALDFPPLSGRVVDQAGIIDASTRSALSRKLAALEAKTTDQLVVVTLNSLQGTSIEDFGVQLGRHWRIGQQGKNNGVLLIVAPNERKVRIEVGYGLEGTLTDAVAKFIIETAILPRFKASDYPGGISRGVDDIVQVLTGDAEDWKRRAIPPPLNPFLAFLKSVGVFVVVLIFVGAFGLFFFVIGMVVLSLIVQFLVLIGVIPPRKQRKGGWGFVNYVDSDTWRVSSSGSSSSSSSDSGFSGGGGDFGGGGSSGSW